MLNAALTRVTGHQPVPVADQIVLARLARGRRITESRDVEIGFWNARAGTAVVGGGSAFETEVTAQSGISLRDSD